MTRLARGPEDFMFDAQGHKELATDLYLVHANCIRTRQNQDLMTSICYNLSGGEWLWILPQELR